jgi:hypothetical protein
MTEQVKNEGLTNAINEAVAGELLGKKWYLSKTFWANIVMAGAVMVQTKYGFIVGPELQALAISFINVGLRKITKDAMVW